MNTIQVVPLKIRNLSKNLLYLGQVYADPRDALNEFVSNAADEYMQSERQGEVIRIYRNRKGDRPWLQVSDRGRGMSRRQLERVATSLCESEKANIREIPEVIGEKGIGILGFASIAERCDLVSRAEGNEESYCMSLVKGKESCTIRLEETRKRAAAGTDVYLYDISKDNLRILTPQKLCEYFRIRRRSALLRGDYAIEIVEG
ncbi:MAG TPA: ATP-binding protein, partial [bacterium]|nr:ATP-binding protein [bacterium]